MDLYAILGLPQGATAVGDGRPPIVFSGLRPETAEALARHVRAQAAAA